VAIRHAIGETPRSGTQRVCSAFMAYWTKVQSTDLPTLLILPYF
jgi:hypothetical protein